MYQPDHLPLPGERSTFAARVAAVDPHGATFNCLTSVQVNLGNRCNLRCAHCHVAASPDGAQQMSLETIETLAACLVERPAVTLDITGGAPELHPHFRRLIELTAAPARRRLVRTNLTVFTEPDQTGLAEFCREQQLALVASLPCYSDANVDRQRGDGAFGRSIAALRRLNALGYGRELELDLVYNPGGAFLPASSQELEGAYRQRLWDDHGIVFTRLLTMANAPLGRFRSTLEQDGKLDTYLAMLRAKFNPAAVGGLMCRSLLSVDWQGQLYDCDFNQVAGLPLLGRDDRPLTLADLHEAARPGRSLRFGEHCLACTAGAGSGCYGAIAANN